jgi:hypothetical protein
MSVNCFYKSELKEELKKELLNRKNFSNKDQEIMHFMLFEIIKEYEFSKILIQQNVSVAGDEGVEYLYFIDGQYLPFHQRKDYARYVFNKSKFATDLKMSFQYHNRYGEALIKLLEAATAALVDYAVSGVFKDIISNGGLFVTPTMETV